MLFPNTAKQFPGGKAENDVFCFLLRREEGGAPGLWEHTKTCSYTQMPLVEPQRATVCVCVCVCACVCALARACAHSLCRACACPHTCGDKMLQGTKTLRLDVFGGFVTGALWVFPRSGCLLTKTYLESIKDLKRSEHQNVITLLYSFTWRSWRWRLGLHTSHRYHSPKLPGSCPHVNRTLWPVEGMIGIPLTSCIRDMVAYFWSENWP